jgi:hypothetical protein
MSAVTKTILKKTRTEVVYRITGTGTVAIALTELALPDETYTPAGAIVEIRKVYVSAPPTQETTITRNAVNVLQLFGPVEWNFEDIKINDQASSDFSVVTAGDGTVILTLRKSVGYDYPYRAENLTNGA